MKIKTSSSLSALRWGGGWLGIVTMLLANLQAADSATNIMTFNGPPNPGHGSIVYYTYTEQNMTLSCPGYGFERLRSGGESTPSNGSDYLWFANNFVPMTLSHVNDFLFGMYSVDLAEPRGGPGSYTPITVDFEGFKADGTTVSISFTTDGICDGNEPLADFETFYFDERFAGDLVRVEIDTRIYGELAMDNLVVFNVVPEPGPLVLLALGGAILAAWRWQIQKSSRRSPQTRG